jgi:hypothetical protein
LSLKNRARGILDYFFGKILTPQERNTVFKQNFSLGDFALKRGHWLENMPVLGIKCKTLSFPPDNLP